MHWQSIPVSVTRNRRARKVWLRMRAGSGLEVVLPYRVSAADVPAILDGHRQWILARFADLAARNEAPGQDPLPRLIRLPFCDRTYHVCRDMGARTELRAGEGVLQLRLPPGAEMGGISLLQRWLVDQGKRWLVPVFRDLAGHHDVEVSKVQIRNQITCWGSCSPSSCISLNAKLLFLPPDVVRHVILHEFCHVLHRNHGSKFKARLRGLNPMSDQHEVFLRKAWDMVPGWSKM